MTPTLRGRLETRLFLVLVVGGAWTAAATPVLPRPVMASLPMVYRVTFEALALTAGVGLGWELVYHALQQLRWDKDWPSLLGLATLLNEGALLWFLLHWTGILPGSSFSPTFVSLFVSYFLTTWTAIWLFMQGPLRVVHLRWRFEGARILPW